MSEIESLFRQQGACSIDVLVRQIFPESDSGLPECHQRTELRLFVYYDTPEKERRELSLFLAHICPKRTSGRLKIHEKHNLDYFTGGESIGITPEFELYVLDTLFRLLAQIDPRIAGKTEQGPVSIERVGTRRYDLCEMQLFYQQVTDSYDAGQRARMEGGNFTHPFIQH